MQFLKHSHQLTRNRKQATCITPIYSYTITKSSKHDKFWSGKTGSLCPVAVLHVEALSVHWVACGFWFGLQINWMPQCCRALSRTSISWELEFYSAALRLIFFLLRCLWVLIQETIPYRLVTVLDQVTEKKKYYRLYSGCSLHCDQRCFNGPEWERIILFIVKTINCVFEPIYPRIKSAMIFAAIYIVLPLLGEFECDFTCSVIDW